MSRSFQIRFDFDSVCSSISGLAVGFSVLVRHLHEWRARQVKSLAQNSHFMPCTKGKMKIIIPTQYIFNPKFNIRNPDIFPMQNKPNSIRSAILELYQYIKRRRTVNNSRQ